MSERPWTIYVDMDGVLVDFVTPALRYFDMEHLLASWPKGEYCMEAVMGIGRQKFAARINGGRDGWWATLPPFPWWLSLLRGLRELGHVVLASCPFWPHPEHSVVGKLRWIERHFEGHGPELVLTRDKSLLARPRAVLVDDSDANVDAFRAAGGAGIVFPQPWNRAVADIYGVPCGPAECVLHRAQQLLSNRDGQDQQDTTKTWVGRTQDTEAHYGRSEADDGAAGG